MVTVLPNDQHDADRLRISTGAYWPYQCDTNLELHTELDIREYTDPHHAANVPHTLVLAPGLIIDKVYVGYWFCGRPSPYQLWEDLRDLFRRIKSDFDPTTDQARAEWQSMQPTVAAPATNGHVRPPTRRRGMLPEHKALHTCHDGLRDARSVSPASTADWSDDGLALSSVRRTSDLSPADRRV
jgi:hypothetical protein